MKKKSFLKFEKCICGSLVINIIIKVGFVYNKCCDWEKCTQVGLIAIIILVTEQKSKCGLTHTQYILINK